MGSVLVMECPNARAAGEIKTLTQTLEPTAHLQLLC